MRLEFLGTRGEIEAKTSRHRRHSSLMVAYKGRRVMIDCGEDWTDEIADLDPPAIVITHAHPDHAWGLKKGAPCPVYATADAWEDLTNYPIDQRHTVVPREPFELQGIAFEAFTVEHSTRCPAVGYRVTAGRAAFCYFPDLVYIHERDEALQNADVYIGDGATLKRSFVRRRGERLIGHTPVQTQLTWCQKEGVPKAIISHCGSQIVEGDERKIGAQVREWARERNIEAEIAHDGMVRVLR